MECCQISKTLELVLRQHVVLREIWLVVSQQNWENMKIMRPEYYVKRTGAGWKDSASKVSRPTQPQRIMQKS
jgi:hypothetical protein